MASAVVPFQDEPESEDQYPKPAIGELGSAWECQKILRRRVKDQNDPHLTRWLNPKAVNVPSVRAMVLNEAALTCLAHWWCPTIEYAKFVPIDLVRAEVGLLKEVVWVWTLSLGVSIPLILT
jgi:hypothetical protein